MKTFEKAMLVPQEFQANIDKQYPEIGNYLKSNPFAKKKKKKGKKKGRR